MNERITNQNEYTLILIVFSNILINGIHSYDTIVFPKLNASVEKLELR